MSANGAKSAKVRAQLNHPIIDTKMDHSLEVGKAGSVTYHVPPNA